MPADITGTGSRRECRRRPPVEFGKARSCQPDPRRRDQPHAAEDPVGAAGSDAEHQITADGYAIAGRAVFVLATRTRSRWKAPTRCRKPARRFSSTSASTTSARTTRRGRQHTTSKRPEPIEALFPRDLLAFQEVVRRVPIARRPPLCRPLVGPRARTVPAAGLRQRVGQLGRRPARRPGLVIGGKARALLGGRSLSRRTTSAPRPSVLRTACLPISAPSEGVTPGRHRRPAAPHVPRLELKALLQIMDTSASPDN